MKKHWNEWHDGGCFLWPDVGNPTIFPYNKLSFKKSTGSWKTQEDSARLLKKNDNITLKIFEINPLLSPIAIEQEE